MKRIREIFRKYFLAGLFSVIPIALSIFIVVWFFNKVDSLFSPLMSRILSIFIPGTVKHIPGMGFILGILIILLFGFFSKTFLVRKILSLVDLILKKIPIAKSIYSTIKTLTEAFSPDNRSAFKEVVLVRYPRDESFVLGFVTKRTLCNDQELDAVYIPTNNLYLGEVLFFSPEDMIQTSLSVEEGIRIVASGGTGAPDCIGKEREEGEPTEGEEKPGDVEP